MAKQRLLSALPSSSSSVVTPISFPRVAQQLCNHGSTELDICFQKVKFRVSWKSSWKIRKELPSQSKLQHGLAVPAHQPTWEFSRLLPTNLQHNFSSTRNRLWTHHRRRSKFEGGQQRTPDPSIDTKVKDTGTSNVESVEDDEENKNAQVLEDQLERFTRAVALDDTEMAAQVMQEMGNPFQVTDVKMLVEGAAKMAEQLQELYEEVKRIIDNGDVESARDIIEANYDALREQLELGVEGIEHAAMLNILAQLRLTLGDFEEAEHLLLEMKNLLDKVGTRSPQLLVDNILGHMGSMYTTLGKPAEEACQLKEESPKIQDDALSKEDSPLVVELLLKAASTYSELEDNEKAIELYNRAIAIIQKTLGPEHESLAVPLTNLAYLVLEEGGVEESELAMLRALGILEREVGAHDRRVGEATCALARIKAAKGQVSAAVNLYQKGLQIMEDCNDVGEDYTTVEIVRSDFATLLDELERNEEAQELWHANLQVKEKLLGSNDLQLAVHLQSLAASYAASEKYDKCEPLLQRSLDLLLANLGPNAPELCSPLDGLATALLHLGRPSEAEPLARQALRICEAAHGSNSIATGDACHCLASIVHTLGESEEALELIYRVLEIQERELLPGSDRFELVPTLELLIKLLEGLGRWSDIPPILLKLQSLTSHLAPEHEAS
ncbi:unnamed protein product [Sphagnum troendelagicum]